MLINVTVKLIFQKLEEFFFYRERNDSFKFLIRSMCC